MKKIVFGIVAIMALAGITLFSGCGSEESEDVAQDRIYTFYRFIYDAKTDKTIAQARFTFGNATGTRLVLSGNSGVTCNDKPLTQTTELINQTYYEAEFTGKVTSGVFKWTDTEEKTYTNTIAIAKSIDYPANFTSISKNSSFDLTWQGDALAAGERADVIINTIHVFTQTINGQTVVTLPKARLDNITSGTANIDLNRVLRVELASGQKTDAGGYAEGVYKAGELAITLN